MNKEKIIIIGLDGATFDLINPLINEGKLPYLQRLIKYGVSGELESTIPPVTAAAWVSFFTGKNPGNHGAFNFRTFDLTKYSSYRETLIDTSWFAGESIFEIISQKKLKVGALGVPMTYPPLNLNGFMISSGSPRMIIDELSVYPPEILSKIGKFDIPVKFGRKNRDYFLNYMEDYLKKHLEICEIMLKEDEFSLFMVVFPNTDWAVHQFWEYTDPKFPTFNEEEAKKYGRVITDQYIAVDKAIGKIITHMDEETILIILSDHGAGSFPIKYFNLNSWLRGKGLLRTKEKYSMILFNYLQNITNHLKTRIQRNENIMRFLRRILPQKVRENISSLQINTKNIIWSDTKAYWVPFIPMFDGIVINMKGKQPEGIVKDHNEYNQIRDYIIEELIKIKDPENDQLVISKIFKKEDIYKGKFIDNAPDLIIMFNEGYTGAGNFNSILIEPIDNSFFSMNSGFHRLNGIFIAYGNSIQNNKKIEKAKLIDLPPTILYSLNIEIPTTMDGEVLKEIFKDDFLKKHEMKYSQSSEKKCIKNDNSSFNSELEQEEMKKNLRGLGYLS